MRISKITVKDLFGIFDHEIPLKAEEHITIIHGPNGYGKTILLTLLSAIFNSRYDKIRPIPFKELAIDFDNKQKLVLKKKAGSNGTKKKTPSPDHSLVFEFTNGKSKPKTFAIDSFIQSSKIGFRTSLIEDFVPSLKRISPQTWLDLDSNEELSLEEILIRYGHRFPPQFSGGIKSAPPLWFEKLENSITIYFINTERLLKTTPSKNRYEYKNRSMEPAVITYSKELVKLIQSKLAEYGTLSQSLDRTFPSRLVKGTKANHLTKDKLMKELSQLEEERKRLMSAGFLDKDKEIDFEDLKNFDTHNANVLEVYIKDVKEKLSVFDELTAKIDLLVKIINERFLHKQLSISKTEGFVFTTMDDKIIPSTSLSSGEQHELVLLYELLFKVEPESLILIDEPELSLHVHWQQQFLNDLAEITKLVGFDVLIATHSPQIINDRWDLTVELEGPKQ